VAADGPREAAEPAPTRLRPVTGGPAALHQSALQETHQRLGARFVEFAGWSMPVQYAGTLAEHTAVRTRVGVFDVSHLGRFTLSGPGATDVLRRLLCNDVARIAPGRAQYTMMLTREGGVVDDIIVWRWADEVYWILPNGVNYERVHAAVGAASPTGTSLTRLQETTAMVAVQGPGAPALLDRVLGWKPRRFGVDQVVWRRHDLGAAGTGYTGERGGEIVVAHAAAPALFATLVEAGAEPCGLGARDVLRLEMGYPLWGQDLGPTTTPLEAGLAWVVSWEHDFVGRAALEAQRDHGLAKRLVAFVFPDRTIPRHGYPLRCAGSEGTVASGTFSPSLGVGIGTGYVAPDPGEVAEAPEVAVEVRGRWAVARRVGTPFLER
jgi:aminomethyltransferase